MARHHRTGPALAALLLGWVDAAPAVEVTDCGQTVIQGFLTADLDCSAHPEPAVVVNGGSLNLAGFTLTGGSERAVLCTDSCTVFSTPPGGRITGSFPPSFWCAIDVDTSVRSPSVSIRDVVLEGNKCGATAVNMRLRRVVARNNSGHGVSTRSIRFNLTAHDSTFENNGGPGVISGRARLVRSSVLGNLGGGVLSTFRVNMKDVLVSGNDGDGVLVQGRLDDVGKMKITSSTVADNTGHGLWAGGKVVVFDSSVFGNGADGASGVGKARRSSFNGNGGTGFHGLRKALDCELNDNGELGAGNDGRLSLRGSTVSGNLRGGLSALGRLSLTTTNATANGGHADCGTTVVCADLASDAEPRLDAASSCQTSYAIGSGVPGSSWGVCSLD